MPATLGSRSYLWLIQSDLQDDSINFIYERDRTFSDYVMTAKFDLTFYLTDIFNDKKDLESKLQIVEGLPIRYINEDAPIFYIYYTSLCPADDILLQHINMVILENKLNVILYKEYQR